MSNAPDLAPGRYRATERFCLTTGFFSGFVVVYEDETFEVHSAQDGQAWIAFEGEEDPSPYRVGASTPGFIRISD
jgi:hypothetical protein